VKRASKRRLDAISIAFLETFSDPDTWLTTTKRRFRAFLKEQNYPYLGKPMSCTLGFMLRLLKRIR
jgi:hypothetical protein